MSNQQFDLNAYLGRIHYTGGRDVSAETLRGLHIAHAMNVPFENLDVFLKKPISLERDDLFNKIVLNHRGGYCFELNGLFSAVLKEMGFQVTNHLARVYNNGFENAGKTHMVVLVEVDNQKWICDVGFGGNGLVAPIRFEEGLEQEHFYRTHRVMADSKYGYRLEFKTDGEFLPIYAFTLEECCPADYLIANHYTSTYPASFFTQLMMCSLSTDVGRITYLDGLLKIVNSVDQDAEIEKKIVNDDEIREVLKQYFGIELLNETSE